MATTLLCGATFAAPFAYAQTEEAADVEAVVVTGSRIKRDTFNTPMPIASVSAETIQDSGNVILGDVLMDLPMVNANSNAQNTSSTLFNSGQARIDLRGLGATRTLVLVDGRRHVFSDAASPAVDLNMIPSLMVERLDAVPGAASAVYGSEAIAGVVNIIMKKKQDGFLFDVQGGLSQQSDGGEFRAGASWGGRFFDDRLNVIVGGEYARQEAIMQADRKWAYPGIRRNTANPQTIVPQSKTNTSPYATFQLRSGPIPGATEAFDPTKHAYAVTLDVRDRTKVTQLSTPCSTATVQSNCQDDALFYGQIYNALQGEVERGTIRGYAEYELTSNVNVFGELSYAKVNGRGISQPAFSPAAGGPTTMPVAIFGDNAFLAGNTSTAADLRYHWVRSGKDFTSGSSAQVGKFWQEFGGRDTEIERETLRAVIGMNGDFEFLNRNISWDWYGQYGETTGKTTAFNVPNVKKVQMATDAILVGGNVVCRATTSADPAVRAAAAGCVPWNLVDGPSAAAVAYANANAYGEQTIKQTVLSANASTDLFDLPAGPVGFAFGAEYRKEESRFQQDALSASGALFFNSIGTRAGEYDVKDVYAELRVPLLKNVPFAEELTFEAAGRISDYSTIGTADQWRLALEWAPIQDIRFRANRGTAVRAPNIVELYAPQSTNFTPANTPPQDPCDSVVYAGATAAQKAARNITCAAAIANWNPATFTSNIGNNRPTLRLLQGGNPDLKPEEATTNQVGVVIQPRFAPGFSMSIDWYRVELEQQIGLVPLQTLLSDLCYDSSTPYASNPFCAAIQRNATGGVDHVKLVNQNVAAVNVEGYDVSTQYRFRPSEIFNGAFAAPTGGDLGDVTLRLDVTRQYTFDLQGLPGQPFTGLANTIPNATPEWKANFAATWAVDKFRFQWQTRYIGSMAVQVPSVPVSSLSPYYTDDYFTHDLRMTYRMNDDVSFRAGVVNFTDEQPPYLPETFTGTGTGASSYDNRGRFFFVGATVSY
ncbi:TonB-dependent receptor plug domain-containing protein [Caulobacter mirabilis]|uniref:TonB-dependent receptor n=1 Tax=Caulobacter mirabilis TaxID=69666 RepID=A0A2D2B246_9CAUL|nr:TonB-dependent receptor [Caulobacter mirabilis]ATQ44276.1 hypothetical protein CSW64_18730 [Caulobacter mirabilis]